MSIPIIRAAFEKRLAAMGSPLATAYENASFVPTSATPYQRLNLLPNTPDNSIQGAGSYLEIGIFQVALCYPIGTGPSAAELKAQAIRALFKRGTSMVESGITVNVTETPKQATGFVDGDRWCVPVSIPWQAQITT